MSNDDLELYHGLTALVASAFPKRCLTCGRVYQSVDDFLHQTQGLRGGRSGLKEASDDENHTVVELFRNCVCGSTLMDVFNDRRDLSEQGLRRRRQFERLLDALEARGIERVQARQELLKLLRDGHSALLMPLLRTRLRAK
ncbi:MAG: oxidoreductase [Thiohalomonadaceae bacterium]